MSLELIVGPPNSGRATRMLDLMRDRLGSEPMLVVPTGDDIARFERDLCSDGRPVAGATIRTFASTFTDAAALAGVELSPQLSAAQRLALVKAAVGAAELRLMRRSAASAGFVRAMDALIQELKAALVSPADLMGAARAVRDDGQEAELADVYARYEELLARTGQSDAGSIADCVLRALRRDARLWRERPVFVYGFDDLSEAQIEFLRLVSQETDVTIAVNYADRDAFAARAGLYARLLDEGGVVTEELGFDASYAQRRSLAHLAQHIFEAELPETPEPDGGLRLMESAGERGEVEAVGIEIARLLADGVAPDAIVVVLRHPARGGDLFARVLGRMGIPVALEADRSLRDTATGRSLIGLARACAGEGEPADVLAHLRSDPASPPAKADWAERRLARREAESVSDLVERWGERVPMHLARVLAAENPGDRILEIAACARGVAELAHIRMAPLVGEEAAGVPFEPLEVRAGLAAAELLEELASLGVLPGVDAPDLTDAADSLEIATIPSWHGPVEGRVRIMSPYRARGATATHLFACDLQEGSFPGRQALDPLLGDESRRALGIAALARADQDLEERYLFCACVSRPTERLYLSWRSADEEGHPAAPSPFIDEAADVVVPDPSDRDPITSTRGLAHVVPAVRESTTPRLLARALVGAAGPDPDAHRQALEDIGADLALAGEVLELTARVPDPGELPGPLAHPGVLSRLAERPAVSANSLEGWLECSYRWFVNHELSPQRLEPVADPLWLGGIVHGALHRLYEDPPASDSIPRPEDVERWKERLRELLDAEVAERSESPPTPDRAVALARATIQAEAFLDEEAERQTDLRPRPDLLERSFGFAEAQGDPGALPLSDLTLRGFIDRIDVAPDGRRAVVRDYKTSKDVPGRKRILDEGKLQLPLYMAVARDLLHLDPIAGLYHPLASYGDRRGRGIALKDECGEGGLLEGQKIVTKGGDAVTREELDGDLDRALEEARAGGARMLHGDIKRDPLAGECPKYCEYQPICRLERAVGLESEQGPEREP